MSAVSQVSIISQCLPIWRMTRSSAYSYFLASVVESEAAVAQHLHDEAHQVLVLDGLQQLYIYIYYIYNIYI